MYSCQKEFLLTRTYNKGEQSIVYLCANKNYIIKLDCSKITLNDIETMDTKVYEAIRYHCQDCK